jgi:PAS domain S-box-containing protein
MALQDRLSQASPANTNEKSIESLRENAEHLRLFVEQAPVGIAMFDHEMRYLAASGRWLTDHGLSEASVIGRSHYEISPEIPQRWKDVHRRGLAGETVREEQDPYKRADGRLLWLKWEVRPWRAANGSIGGILIFTEDVTARVEMERALRESREDLDRAQAVARTGSWRLDVNRNNLTWSAETFRIFGISPETPLTYESFLAAVHPDDREHVDRSWNAALEGARYDIEHRIVVGKKLKWVRERAELEFDAAGKLLGGFGTVQDITDKKQIEWQLRESEERLRLSNEAGGIGAFTIDLESNCAIYSPELSAMLGFPGIGKAPVEVAFARVHCDDQARIRAAFRAALQTPGNGGLREEFRFMLPGGEVRWMRWNGRVDFREGPSGPIPSMMFGACVDITGLKRTEMALRESEKLFRATFETAAVGVAHVAPNGSWLLVNRRLGEILGYQAEELTNKKFQDITHPDHLEADLVQLGRLLRDETDSYRVEKRYLRKDGSIVWARLSVATVRKADRAVDYFISVVEDIDERKRAEEKLRQSEARYRVLHESLRDPFVQVSMDGRIIEFNDLYCQMLGYSPDEIRALTYQDLTPQRWHAFEEGIVQDQIIARGYSDVYEKEYRRKDGAIIPVELRAMLSRDAWGRPDTMWAIVRDITERKRAEATLRESEERFHGIFKHAGTGIAISDMQGRFQSCNPAFSAMLGYTEEEFKKLAIADLQHPDDRDMNLDEVRRLVEDRIPSFEISSRHLRKDGKVVWVHKHVSLLRDASGKPTSIIALVTDITERKRQEEQIKLLMSEVNHRSKNLLALVLAIARQTAATSADDFIDRFQERILALTVSQDLLVRNKWKGVHLDKLARSQLAHFNDLIGTRIKISGPPLLISAFAAQTLGMALHELATNAGKYGALSTDGGSVEVTWRVENTEGVGGTFLMSWRESGGPIVEAPACNGFGSTVIGQMAEMSLNGTVDLDYASSGLVWRLQSPIGSVLEENDHCNLESEKLADERLRQSQTLLV